MKLLYFIFRLIELNKRYNKIKTPKQTFNYTTKVNYYIKLPYTPNGKGNKKTG